MLDYVNLQLIEVVRLIALTDTTLMLALEDEWTYVGMLAGQWLT